MPKFVQWLRNSGFFVKAKRMVEVAEKREQRQWTRSVKAVTK